MKRSILIVEDEPVVALEMEALLERAGFAIQGCTGSIEKALAMLDAHKCDAAVLDANLRGRSCEPVAAVLERRGTPFLVVSGSGLADLPAKFVGAPLVSKPFEARQLVEAVKRLLA